LNKLPARQQRFVDEYLIDLNGTQAAIRAGYSPRTANQQASRLLTKQSIQEAIAVAKAERSRRTKLMQDKVIRQLEKIAFADIKDVVTWDGELFSVRPSEEIDGTILAEIREKPGRNGVARTVKLNDRMKALLKLYDHLGDERQLQLVKLQAEIEKLGFVKEGQDLELTIKVNYGDDADDDGQSTV